MFVGVLDDLDLDVCSLGTHAAARVAHCCLQSLLRMPCREHKPIVATEQLRLIFV